MRRGLSLIELLASIVMVSIVTGAVTRTVIAGIRFQARSTQQFDARADRIRFEDTLRRLLTGADLHGQGSFFVAPVPGTSTVQQMPQDDPLGAGTASLVFTTSEFAPSASYLAATDRQFEGLNSKYGPMSDCTEVAFSTIPVGDGAGMRQGLFLRQQSPADTDPSQGGTESLLYAELKDIRFEFYDGSNWSTTWDSRSDNKGKLPSAVRITYILQSERQPRQMFVRLPMSDLFTGAKSSS